jgi:hypothetical protein
VRDRLKDPFGKPDCEKEIEQLKDKYSEIYFDETPFSLPAIDEDVYLIVGRRGSGKTALTQYFSFQDVLPNPIAIEVYEADIYQQVLSEIAQLTSDSREIAVPHLARVWEYVLWSVIFEHLRHQSAVIKAACPVETQRSGVSHYINDVFHHLMAFFKRDSGRPVDVALSELVRGEQFETAKQEVFAIATTRPIFLAIDTLEKYNIYDDALMNAMAALIQCASTFNSRYADRGIHLKVFMSGEVFPYLREEVLLNPSKSVREPVYLLWRPKDLLRLITWRLHQRLSKADLLKPESRVRFDWDEQRHVLKRMWVPYFGNWITNLRGTRERTFAYVLRHTQLRPRQLIILCNAIAKRAQKAGRFPTFDEDDIRRGIRENELELANEIINSFSSMYPHVGKIVDALMSSPMIFPGKELDRRAKETASQWPRGMYSPPNFRQLVAELGIVGRVRKRDDRSRYVSADFEYSSQDRMPLATHDECVIHPMFYRRFNTDMSANYLVMPFSSDHEEQAALED